MVAVPLLPPVQRYQQQVRPGQIRQGRPGPGQVEYGLAQRPGHPLKHRGPGQERPLPAGDPGQELRLHILAHQPVIPAEGDRRARQRAALPQVKSRQVQPGRPALGPPVQPGHLILGQRHLSVAQQRRRLLTGQRQIPGADLQDPALGAQPRHPQRRLGPPRQRQPRAGRHMIGQHRQRGAAFGVVQRVHVIQDQRDRRGHRPECGSEPGDDRAGHRARRGGQRVEHPSVDRLDRVQRFRDIGQQDLRIVVPFVDRHPRERLAIALGPLRKQRRLPVTRRRDHRDNRTPIAPRQPFDQRRTTDGPGPYHRTAELRRQKVERRTARPVRPVGPFTHAAAAHAPTMPPGMVRRSMIFPSHGSGQARQIAPHQRWLRCGPPRTRRMSRAAIDAEGRSSRPSAPAHGALRSSARITPLPVPGRGRPGICGASRPGFRGCRRHTGRRAPPRPRR